MQEARGTIAQHHGSGESIDVCRERLVIALGYKSHDGAICCVCLMRLDVGIQHLIGISIVGGKVDKHTLSICMYVGKLGEQIRVRLCIV